MKIEPCQETLSGGSLAARTMYRAKWALMKIKDRDPLYLPRRLSYSVNRFIADATFPYRGKNRGRLNAATPESPAELLRYFRTRTSPSFHFDADAIPLIVAGVPTQLRRQTVEAAEEILRGRFTHKGVGPVLLDPMDWEHDVPGTSGWRWTANRHFMFTTLGFAYWYTEERRFADRFIELCSSWIDAYVGKLGSLEWDHPFEVAARINAWIWAYFLFLPCRQLDACFHKRLLWALGNLTDYLYEVIEYHNQGNHILLEAKALALCAGVFPEFTSAGRWREKSWRILRKELQSQICPDGVHAERSTMYHRIVAGELAELLLFCTRNGMEAGPLGAAVPRMAEFEAWFTGGQRDMPVFGDAYREDSYYRFSSAAIAAASDPAFPAPCHWSRCGDATYWALGAQAACHDDAGKRNPATSLAKDFRDGGYFVSRWGWDSASSVLVWDCGPVGYRKNPYHCHLDTLSFNLTVDGVAMVVDPGIEERDVVKNRLLRGSAAHNTVVVDGENQSLLAPLGRKNEIWCAARPSLLLWVSGADCDVMTGSHDGYRRLPHPVTHRRTIVSMRHRYWLVFDSIEGEGGHGADQRFHLAPGSVIGRGEDGAAMTLGKEGVSLSFFAVAPESGAAPGAVTVEAGLSELTPNRIEPIQVINVRVEAEGSFEMAAVMAPAAAGVAFVKRLPGGGIEIRGRDFCDVVCVGHGKTGGLELERWRSDAGVLILRKQGGLPAELYAAGATMLFRGEEDLMGGRTAPLLHLSLKDGGSSHD